MWTLESGWREHVCDVCFSRIATSQHFPEVRKTSPSQQMMSKRTHTLDTFFTPSSAKRSKTTNREGDTHLPRESSPDTYKPAVAQNGNISSAPQAFSTHSTYPFPIPYLSATMIHLLTFAPAAEARVTDDQPGLDLLYCQPYVPKEVQRGLFHFLRQELFFYRVKYHIKRGPVETEVNTPRFTTVFGLDETARFEDGELVDAATGKLLPTSTYHCRPRLIPQCLDTLRELTEIATGCRFNFALVNFYATGMDSISYHSDDERFLGVNPAIASFALGASRNFLLKHKPTAAKHESEATPIKLPLAPGDMILMRGKTQHHWLHSIPKRKGRGAYEGRINITFRRARMKEGTGNYYKYNVGEGPSYRWDGASRAMLPWQADR